MKSRICRNECIANSKRKFGSATVYYPVNVIDYDGTAATGLFTEHEVDGALARGEANPEDVAIATQPKTLWERFRQWLVE